MADTNNKCVARLKDKDGTCYDIKDKTAREDLSNHIQSMTPVLECVSELDNTVNNDHSPMLNDHEARLESLGNSVLELEDIVENLPTGGGGGASVTYDASTETLTIS